ncbi:unnamed protein product, partial [Mesorhabditis belari]|uniref:Uncharacterized protein n=1 Tax=Mesorhabditis belari TaxID=2138241 RepID=A0AAF3F2R0_9BILA
MEDKDRLLAKELESFGYPGPTQIRQNLSKAKDLNQLVEAIKKFKTENSLDKVLGISSLAPALRLLDMHNVKRVDIHDAVAADLTDKFLQRLKELGKSQNPEAQKKLEDQLEKCFKMYKVHQIRPIVLETLNNLRKVPDRYLKIVLCDAELYSECAVSVRQQIWLKNDKLFEEAVLPVLESYLRAKRNVECMIEPSTTNFFTSETTKSRRQQPQVQTLMQMIGNHDLLYEKVISIIRNRYAETADVNFCSLRMELLMAAHDMNNESATKIDPSYELAKCLDACVRDKHMDSNLTSRLRTVLEKKWEPEELGDVAMVAWDSHVVHFLCSIITRFLREGSSLPRDSLSLQLLIKVLALGSQSHNIVKTSTITSTIADSIFLTKFIPSLAKMIVEDVMRIEIGKSSVDVSEEFGVNSLLSNASDTAVTFLKADVCASLLWLHQMIEILPNKKRTIDSQGFLRYAEHIIEFKGKLGVRGPWCHLLVHRLISANAFDSVIQDEAIQLTIVNRLLMENIQADPTVKYQLLRIVYQLHSHLGLQKATEIMETIAIDKLGDLEAGDKEKYERDYMKTMDRITPKIEEEHPPTLPPGMTPAHPMATGQQMHPGMTPRIGVPGQPHPSMTPGPGRFAPPLARPQYMTPRH